jgi:hypothetical protein
MGLAPKDALSWRGSIDTGFGPNNEKEKLWRKSCGGKGEM